MRHKLFALCGKRLVENVGRKAISDRAIGRLRLPLPAPVVQTSINRNLSLRTIASPRGEAALLYCHRFVVVLTCRVEPQPRKQKSMRAITLASQKGGTGKSTLCIGRLISIDTNQFRQLSYS